ncbi:MAG: DUF1700 domain-containing protein [Oscillospiraceae bacterium]|nr:DUF1700 domain-containing protein [Oscillospiraceae bacterium]
MTKIEFIHEVRAALAGYPEDEVIKSLTFYTESIDDRIEDGMPEETAVSQLGNIGEIIQNIKLSMSIPVLAKARVKESKEKSSNKKIWVILAIAGFPLWLPLGLSFASVLLAIYICIWALVISLFACEIAFGVSAAVGLVYSFIHMITISYQGGIMFVGASLFLAGLFVLLIKPVIRLSGALVKSTGGFIRWIKKLFISKGGR